jgi:hypothetical protein
MREQWPIKPEYRTRIIATLMLIVADPNKSARERTSAAKAIMAADKLNLRGRGTGDQGTEQHHDRREDARLDRIARIAERLGHHGVAAAITARGPESDLDGVG